MASRRRPRRKIEEHAHRPCRQPAQWARALRRAELRPVDRGYECLGRRADHESLQHVEPELGAKPTDTSGLGERVRGVLVRGSASVTRLPDLPGEELVRAQPESPVHAQRRMALSVTTIREGVEEGIRCGVRALTGHGEHGGQRREEHEVIEVPELGGERPGPDHLRQELFAHRGLVEIAYQLATEHRSRVEHRPHRRPPVGLELPEARPQRRVVPDVHGRDVHGHAQALQVTHDFDATTDRRIKIELRPRGSRRELRPAQEQQTARTCIDQPACELAAHSAERAGDEARTIGPDSQRRHRGELVADEARDMAVTVAQRHLALGRRIRRRTGILRPVPRPPGAVPPPGHAPPAPDQHRDQGRSARPTCRVTPRQSPDRSPTVAPERWPRRRRRLRLVRLG